MRNHFISKIDLGSIVSFEVAMPGDGEFRDAGKTPNRGMVVSVQFGLSCNEGYLVSWETGEFTSHCAKELRVLKTK